MLAGQSWEHSWSEVADFGGLASGGGVCGSGGGGGRCGIAGGRGVGGDAGGARGCWWIIGRGGRCRIATPGGGGGDDGLGLASPIAEFALKIRMYRSRLWNF